MNVFSFKATGLQWRDGLEAGLHWWTGELAALLPEPLRRAAGEHRKAIIIEFMDSEIFVNRAAGDRRETTARIVLDPLAARTLSLSVPKRGTLKWLDDPVILRLSPKAALQRDLTLPATARPDIDNILRYEVERLSPIAVDEIYYDYRMLVQSSGALQIGLRIIRRDAVEGALAICQEAGIAPSAIEFIGDERRADGGNFPVEKAAAQQIAVQRWKIPALVVAIVFLGLCFVGAVYWRQQAAADDLAARAADISVQARGVETLRHKIALAQKRAVFLGHQKASPSAVRVLAEVSRLLPDGAWLSEFAKTGDEVRIQGLSNAAASLIAVFDSSPDFSDAQFRSPLTQGPSGQLERFDLSFRVKHR